MILTITLTDAEMATAKMIANLRSIVARANNVVDVRKTGNPLDMDELGMVAEFAFCKYWNIFCDIAPAPKSGGYDCILNGKRIDIKATHYKDGRLIKTLKENKDVDCYALAIVDGNTVTFPGYAFSIELCQPKNIRDLGHGDNYVMDQKDLRQWKDQ